jgi:hypothetical protein
MKSTTVVLWKNETWQVQKTHTCTSHEMHHTEMHVLFFCSTETHSGGATYGGELRIVGLLPFITQVFLNTSLLYVIVLAEAQFALLHLRW